MAFNFGKLKQNISLASDNFNPFDRQFQQRVIPQVQREVQQHVVQPTLRFAKVNVQQPIKRVINREITQPIIKPAVDYFKSEAPLVKLATNKNYRNEVSNKIANINPKNPVARFATDALLGTQQERRDYLSRTNTLKQGGVKLGPIVDPTKIPENLKQTAKDYNKVSAQNAIYAVMDMSGGLGKPVQKVATPVVQKGLKVAKGKVDEVISTLSQPKVVATPRTTESIIQELPKGQLPKIARNIPETSSANLSLGKIVPQFDPKLYIKEQTKLQKQAAQGGGFLDKLQGFKQEVKTKFVERFSVIEDTLTKAEKQGKLKVLPTSDIRPQLDRVLRADSIATQFAKDKGLAKIIQDVPDVKAFDQYLIARQARDVAKNGIETGRNLAKDNALIDALAPQYENFAIQANKYNQDVLSELVDSGMINKTLRDELIKKYPNYVPMNRVFSEIEQQTMGMGGKGSSVASVGLQKVVKKLTGSKREIVSPIESMLTKTSDAIGQAERNKAARMLVSYKDLPGNPFGIKPISETTTAKGTISAFIDGKKQMFEIDPEFARASKDMGKQQIGFLGQIFAVPTRILKMGATGLNLPFVASNIVKDQVYATINSSKALKTSLANPVNFVKATYSSLGQDKLYDDWVRSGASFTSYDLSRNTVKPTIGRIRGQKNIGTKVLYEVTHPQDLLRVAEDIIGKSEELTRIQQFNGMKQALIKEGRTIEDATILASQASNQNTANFARGGEWTTPLNAAIPYINAGIQGARSLTRNLVTRPVQTSAKIAALVFTPIAYATAWNLGDPERKAAYDDIPDYEKENNIIILPPSPVQDENGRWNAIKIPLTPGLSNLGSIVRRQMEGINSTGRTATDVLAALSSFDVSSPSKLASQMIPQGIKAPLESYTNTNFFTGQKIVPEYMKSLDPEMQVKDNTSGSARKLGKVFNTSPLKVENFIRTTGGGVGSQLLNASDNMLAKAGVIPQEQIGGKGVGEQISNRFTSTAGGVKRSQIYDTINKQKADRLTENINLKKAIANGETLQVGDTLTKQRLTSLTNTVQEDKAKESLTGIQKAIFGTTKDEKLALLQSIPQLADDIAKVQAVEDSLKSSSKAKLGKLKLKKSKKGRKIAKIKTPKLPRIKIGSSKLKTVKLKTAKIKSRKLKVAKLATVRKA